MALLYIISILLLIYGIFAVARNRFFEGEEEAQTMPGAAKALTFGAILFAFTLVFDAAIIVVDGQEIAVRETPNGISENEVMPGWKFVPPWHNFHYLDNTIWVYNTQAMEQNSEGSSQDHTIWATTKSDSLNTIGSKIGLDVSVSWKIDPTYGSWIYQNLGNQMGEEGYSWISEYIIKPSVNSAVNSSVRQYSVFQANNNRDKIQQQMKEIITEELSSSHLICMDVQIRGVHFDSGLEAKIKETQIARQEAERQKEVTKQITEQEAQAIKKKNIAITEAQGKAEAIKLSAQALEQNPKLVEFEYVKALQMSAEQGVKIVPDMVLGNSSNMFYSLPNK